MKSSIFIAVLMAASLGFTSAATARGSSHSFSTPSHSSGDHYTSGYTRHDGTHVSGYHATNPNTTRNDNYSTRGNLNPYTGEIGTKPRDGE